MTQDFTLETRAVGRLLTPEMRFLIPSYQRGYRWEADQILALLNDLKEFEGEPEASAFYCLQPLVVARNGSEWEVVDGQQRLTTLFLVLRHLNQGRNLFGIRYARHPHVDGGLHGLLLASAGSSGGIRFVSPDRHYLENADRIISAWLEENPECLRNTLMAADGRCAKFIWYELSRHDAVETFKNLNAGKIRLTDAELIRALLLRKGELPDEDRQQIALRWDQIERKLQEPEFWSFLTMSGESENRIDWLFRLVESHDSGKQFDKASGSGNRQVFDSVLTRFKFDNGRQQFWNSVEHVFSTLEEWFVDDRLFHVVGLLVMQGASLNELLLDARLGKKGLWQRLKKKARHRLFDSDMTRSGMAPALEDIAYGDRNTRHVLICLNIATLSFDESRSVRLSFHGYNSKPWDIEHIRATASAEPRTLPDYVETLKAIAAYLTTHRHERVEIDQYKAISDALVEVKGERPEGRKERLAGIYRRLRDQIEGKDEDIGAYDGLRNLTLLPADMNRSIGAQPFCVKRVHILERDLRGTYLLPCTRHVFSKSFTPSPSNLIYWTISDAEGYMKAIVAIFDRFFADTWEEVA